MNNNRISRIVKEVDVNGLPVLEGVTFRHIAGHPGYAIGDNGSVYSSVGLYRKSEGRWLKLSVTQRKGRVPYCVVCLREDRGRGKVVTRYIHRLVLESFIGPCPDGMECLHGDGDATNNSLANLRWGTRSDNAQDRIRHGTHAKGTESWNAGLNFIDVVVAMRLKEIGVRHDDIGDILGISQSTISSLGKEDGRYQRESFLAKRFIENDFEVMRLIESHDSP